MRRTLSVLSFVAVACAASTTFGDDGLRLITMDVKNSKVNGMSERLLKVGY